MGSAQQTPKPHRGITPAAWSLTPAPESTGPPYLPAPPTDKRVQQIKLSTFPLIAKEGHDHSKYKQSCCRIVFGDAFIVIWSLCGLWSVWSLTGLVGCFAGKRWSGSCQAAAGKLPDAQLVVCLGCLCGSAVLGLGISMERSSLNLYPEDCLILTSLLGIMVAFAFAKSIWRSPACCWLATKFILVRLRLEIVRINILWL